MSTRFPVFDRYVFTEVENVIPELHNHPAVYHALFARGVPKEFIGRRYRADNRLSLVSLDRGKCMLRFGSSGLANAIGVNLDNENVVEVIEAPSRPVIFVNTSIEKFTETIKALLGRLPYYSEADSLAAKKAAADDLLEIIGSIDPEAVVPDRYWSTFVDNVEMGDLTTEDILAIDDQR